MALSETIEYDKIEVVGEFKNVQVRQATVIKKDGTEIARSFHRYVLTPDMDLSARSEPNEVVAICNAAWTQEVTDAWKTFQESPSQPLQ